MQCPLTTIKDYYVMTVTNQTVIHTHGYTFNHANCSKSSKYLIEPKNAFFQKSVVKPLLCDVLLCLFNRSEIIKKIRGCSARARIWGPPHQVYFDY